MRITAFLTQQGRLREVYSSEPASVVCVKAGEDLGRGIVAEKALPEDAILPGLAEPIREAHDLFGGRAKAKAAKPKVRLSEVGISAATMRRFVEQCAEDGELPATRLQRILHAAVVNGKRKTTGR